MCVYVCVCIYVCVCVYVRISPSSPPPCALSNPSSRSWPLQVFLMRNLAPLVMQVSQQNVQSASIAIAVLQFVFVICLKKAIF